MWCMYACTYMVLSIHVQRMRRQSEHVDEYVFEIAITECVGEWFINRLCDWPIEWLMDSLIDSSFLICGLDECMGDWVIYWLIGWWVVCWMRWRFVEMMRFMQHQLIDLFLISSLNAWMFERLLCELIDWLVDCWLDGNNEWSNAGLSHESDGLSRPTIQPYGGLRAEWAWPHSHWFFPNAFASRTLLKRLWSSGRPLPTVAVEPKGTHTNGLWWLVLMFSRTPAQHQWKIKEMAIKKDTCTLHACIAGRKLYLCM